MRSILFLADGTVRRAAALRITDTETSWIADGEVARVPTCAVAEIREVPAARPSSRSGRGALIGGVLGAISAALVAPAVCGFDDVDTACAVGYIAAVGGLTAAAGAWLGRAPKPPAPRSMTLAPTCDATVRTEPLGR